MKSFVEGQPKHDQELIEAAARHADEIAAAMPTVSPFVGPAFTQPPPESMAGYEIIRELHRGGQGVVYQAIQNATKRKVAIKVMREGPLADARDKARFEREVRILGQLKHPNIVAIYDSAVSQGCSYYVMDYISGQPLDVYMASGERSMEETLRLFSTICDAINAAHLRGVIHRDLKPSNILVDSAGQPHILDFGLAKIAAGATTDESVPRMMTLTGQFVGSLPFASPEQAAGSPDQIDIRSDVYSLGVILYQMLTGCFPYVVVGNMRDVLQNILNAQPIRPSTVRRQIKDEVETIVLKCLSKQRERRYQSAGELGRDVIRYLEGQPIEAKRDSILYVLHKAVMRHKAPIAACLLITVVLGLSYAAWQRNHELAQTNRRQHIVELVKAPWNYRTSEPETEDLYDDFFARLKSGRTSPEERELFCRNLNHIDLVCRSLCGLDHDWHVGILMTSRAYFKDQNLWMRIHTIFYLGGQQIAEMVYGDDNGGKGGSSGYGPDLIKLAELKPAIHAPVQLELKAVTTISLHSTPFPGYGSPVKQDRSQPLCSVEHVGKRQVTILPILPPNYPFAIDDPIISNQVEEAFKAKTLWVSKWSLGFHYDFDMPMFITGHLQLLDPDNPEKVLAEFKGDLPPGPAGSSDSMAFGPAEPNLSDEFLDRVRTGQLTTVRIRLVPDREQAIRSPTIEAYYGKVIERTVKVDLDANRLAAYEKVSK